MLEAKLLVIKISQLFIFMFLGFAIAKICKMKRDDSMILSKMGLYLLIPAVILNSFNRESTPEIIKGLLVGAAAAIVVHIIFFILDLIYQKVFKAKPADRASMIYSNAGNIVVPLVASVFGSEWVIYTLSYISVQQLFIWTQGVHIFEKNKEFDIKKIIINPSIITVFLGILMMAFGIRLPQYVSEITAPLADMVGIVGMLIVGVVAANIDYKVVLREKRLYIISVMRMIVAPLAVFIVYKLSYPLIPIDNARMILLISFLSCCMPIAATIMQLSQVYDEDVELVAATNITTTLLSIITVPIFIALF